MKKVVIKVSMNDDSTRFYCFGAQSSRCKAMRVAISFAGVQSVALVEEDKDRIEVVGERVDVVKLTTLLRKNVGFKEIVTVGEADTKKAENEDTAPQPIICRTLGGSRTVKLPTSWIHTHVIVNPHARSCKIDKDQ